MNEDLHDIDDLFRNHIDDHLEDVPPDVWEAVNNDLDKKQAYYYRRKYNRLKRAGLLLLLLCFVGGSYVMFYLSNPKQTALVQKKPDAVVPPSDEKNKTTGNTEKSTVSMPAAIDQRKKTDTLNDTGFLTSVKLPPAKKAKKTTDVLIKGLRMTNSFDPYKTSERKSKEMIFSDGDIAESKEGQADEHIISDLHHSLQLYSLQSPSLMSYSKQLLIPQTLSVNHRTLMATTAPRSTRKNNAIKAHGFSLSAFAAPNFSFDRLEDDKHLAGPGRNRHDAHENEQQNVSFSGGLLLNYELTKNISIQSGVSVTSSSTSIAPKTVYAKADNNGHTRYELHCSSGYVYISPKGNVQPVVGDSAKTSGTTSKLAYLNIPASINYRINVGHFSLLPSLGVGLNILASGKTKTSLFTSATSESTTTSISGLRPTYMDGNIGIGIEYGLNRRLSISLRPNAKLALTPINKETPVKSYENFLSLETGVRIKMNR